MTVGIAKWWHTPEIVFLLEGVGCDGGAAGAFEDMLSGQRMSQG